MILYVLGGLIVQNLDITVSKKERRYRDLESRFVAELKGEVTGFSEGASSFVLQVKLDEGYGVVCFMDTPTFNKIGDYVLISGEFYKPSKPSNRGEFNQYVYYRGKGIDLLVSRPDISVMREADTNKWMIRFKNGLYSLKKRFSTVYDKCVSNEYVALIKAMIIGEKAEIDEEIKQLYQKNNISHLLSISGLHVGVLSGLFYKLLRRCGVSYVMSGVVGIVVTFSYGYMTGNADATLRAAIMVSLAMIAGMVGRTYDMLTAMSLSVLILYISNPLKIYDGGFLLSYGAVVGIGAIYPMLQQVFSIKCKLGQTLLLNISIVMSTLPISLFFYGTYSPYSVLVNIIILPTTSIFLVCGLLGGFVGLFHIELATWLLKIPSYILWFYEWICRKCLKLPNAYVILGAMEVWELLLYFGMLVLVMIICLIVKWRRKKERIKHFLLYPMMVMGCFCIMIFCSIYRPTANTLSMLDVGQGQCVVLTTASGLHIMVDGGSTSRQDIGKYVIQPFLKHEGINKLDYVVITHGDVDHISGITYLIEQSDNHEVLIDSVVMAKCCQGKEEYQEIEKLATSNGISVIWAKTGDGIRDEGFSFTCLYPSKAQTSEEINQLSLVFLAEYANKNGNRRVLLTGDIGEEQEDKLIQYQEAICDIEVLVVAHHGSRYSSSGKFLKITKPQVALISAGQDNSYGHPHAEVVKRLKEVGSEIRCTAWEGMVDFNFTSLK